MESDKELSGRYFSDVELARRYDIARVSVWRWSAQGILPKPVRVGPNTSRWVGQEVAAAEDRWLAAREKRFGKGVVLGEGGRVEETWTGEVPHDAAPAPAASPRKPRAQKARAKSKSARRVSGVTQPQAEG